MRPVALSDPAAPIGVRPGPDTPTSPDPDVYLAGIIPSERLDVVTAAQLEPVPATESRRPWLQRVTSWHDEVTLPRQLNRGGRVAIARRSSTPDGQQTGSVGAPAPLAQRGPVPTWTDPYVAKL